MLFRSFLVLFIDLHLFFFFKKLTFCWINRANALRARCLIKLAPCDATAIIAFSRMLGKRKDEEKLKP